MNQEINNYSCCILTQEEEENYSRYIKNHSEATFEYTLNWRNILEKNFGFKPYYIICKDKNDQIKGILPLFLAKSLFGKRLVSTPYAIYTGIMAENEEIKEKIIDFSRELSLKEKVNFLEIREKDVSAYPLNFKMEKISFNFSLSLSLNPEEVWKKMPKSSVRWGIKKAQNGGLTWNVGNGKKELNKFYHLFLQTRKFRGVPAYPYTYFEDILNNFEVKIYLAKLKEKPLAAIFLIFFKDEVRYAFAGAIHQKKFLQMQPYHLILWEAIKDASLKGYKTFNFGGATLNTNEGGLFDFKKKWADTVTEAPSYFYLLRAKELPGSDNQLIFRIAGSIWKRLPLSLIRLLSPKIIKQFV